MASPRTARATCSCGDGCVGTLTVGPADLAAMEADFTAVTGSAAGGFVCPLCARLVDAGCASEAHAPAEKVGGKVVTLICRRCNSRMGTWYEATTVEMLRTRQVGKSGRWTERYRVGSGEPGRNLVNVAATFETDAEGVLTAIGIHGPKGSSAAGRYWADEVKRITSSPDKRVRFESRVVDQRKVGRAFASWAFLSLTAVVGYRFALAEGSRVVADALLDRTSTVLGKRHRLNLPRGDEGLGEISPSAPLVWSLAGDPGSLDAVGWQFGDFIALLPWPTDATGEVYRRLDELADAGAEEFGRGWPLDVALLRSLYGAPGSS